MSAEETLKIISKQWCTLEDLMILLGCGRNKALEVKKNKKKLLKEGYYIPGKSLPMQEVVETLKPYSHLFTSTLDEVVAIIDNLDNNKTDDN